MFQDLEPNNWVLWSTRENGKSVFQKKEYRTSIFSRTFIR
jgi:hypothetical protein